MYWLIKLIKSLVLCRKIVCLGVYFHLSEFAAILTGLLYIYFITIQWFFLNEKFYFFYSTGFDYTIINFNTKWLKEKSVHINLTRKHVFLNVSLWVFFCYYRKTVGNGTYIRQYTVLSEIFHGPDRCNTKQLYLLIRNMSETDFFCYKVYSSNSVSADFMIYLNFLSLSWIGILSIKRI